jgi:osmotically-inducible protein OsmY
MKTDLTLQRDVMAELQWEPAINAAQIGVEVKKGVVILAGHVDTYAEKYRAEKAAQRVDGVKALITEIEVVLPDIHHRSDMDIASAINNMMDWATFNGKEKIHVMVENGWATLSGAVEWEFQHKAALQMIRYVTGIRGIHDHIVIKPKISVSVVRSDIEAAMKRRALKDASDVHVDIHDSDIVLTGKVHSLAERTLVERTAWDTPGVRTVIDHLEVV